MTHFSWKFLIPICTFLIVFNQKEVLAQESNWTHFRGTNLDGKSADNQVPVVWNDTTNVIWETEIRGKARALGKDAPWDYYPYYGAMINKNWSIYEKPK